MYTKNANYFSKHIKVGHHQPASVSLEDRWWPEIVSGWDIFNSKMYKHESDLGAVGWSVVCDCGTHLPFIGQKEEKSDEISSVDYTQNSHNFFRLSQKHTQSFKVIGIQVYDHLYTK